MQNPLMHFSIPVQFATRGRLFSVFSPFSVRRTEEIRLCSVKIEFMAQKAFRIWSMESVLKKNVLFSIRSHSTVVFRSVIRLGFGTIIRQGLHSVIRQRSSFSHSTIVLVSTGILVQSFDSDLIQLEDFIQSFDSCSGFRQRFWYIDSDLVHSFDSDLVQSFDGGFH